MTPEQEATIRSRAVASTPALHPLLPGNNSGKVWTAGGSLAADFHGHEANAKFFSHARSDVLALLDAVAGLRSAIEAMAVNQASLEKHNRELLAKMAVLDEERDRLEQLAQFLFQLLDDIDTADDIAKEDHGLYRALVHHLHSRRFEVATTDGYTVTWKPETEAAS